MTTTIDPYLIALGNALVAGTITSAEFDFKFDAHLAAARRR